MHFRRTLLSAAIIAAGLSGTVQAAETDSKSATLLNQITVTATRTDKKLQDVAGSVSVIDDEQIEDQMVQDISDLVRYEPGVSVSSDTRTGLGNFNIRGMDGNRIKIIVDDVDQANDFTTTATYYLQGGRNFIDIETLKAVEIVKGPASSLYGSDAIGGLVAFQTKDPADLLDSDGDGSSFSIKGAYSGANEGFTETLSAANRSNQLESMLIYTRRDTRETETRGSGDAYGARRGEANPSHNRLDNILAKAQLQLNSNHRIGLTGEFQDSRSNIDVKDSRITDGVTGSDSKTRTRAGVFHKWQAHYSAFDSLEWQLDWQDTETTMETYVPQYSAFIPYARDLEYHYQEKGFQLNAQLEKHLQFASLKHNLIYGLNYEKGDASNKSTSYNLTTGVPTARDYIPEIDMNIWGAFAQSDIALTNRLTITPGLRFDNYGYRPGMNRATQIQDDDSEGSKLTGRLASVYKLNSNLSAFAQLSQGFKAPDLIDLYWNYTNVRAGYSFRANPDLKPEESNNLELGFRGEYNFGNFEATAFYSHYKNFIENESHQEGALTVTTKQNISRAKIKGLELKGQLWLDEALNAPSGTTLRASLAYARGKNSERNEPLNSVAPLTAVIGLGYDAPSTIWGGEINWTIVDGKKTSQVSDSESVYITPGFGVLDLTAYYSPARDLTLRAGLFNITDKKYWSWNNTRTIDPANQNMDRYSEPGRNISFSAKYTF